MAISIRGVNNAAGQNNGTTTTAGTAAITPTMPGSAAAGDRIFVFQAASNTSGTTPTNWNVVGSKDTVLGTGTVAASAGLRYSTWYWRDYDGSWSMPSFPLTSATNNSHWIGAIAITPTAGYQFSDTPTISTVNGAFNTAATAYTDTSAATFTTTTNGLLLVGTGLNDNVTATTGALSQTGATIGTVTERCDGGTATGNDVAGKIHTAPVTTGASAAITTTMTLSAASQGETRIVQQTEFPIELMSTFIEEFDQINNWDNTTLWGYGSSGLGTTSLGRTINSKNWYSITNDSIVWQFKTGNYSGSNNFDVGIRNASGVFWGFRYTVGFLVAFANGSSLGAPTAPMTTNMWLRIRHASGQFHYEYAPNDAGPLVWTTMHSTSTVPSNTGMVEACLITSGTGTIDVQIDHLNNPPATPIYTLKDDFSTINSSLWDATNWAASGGFATLTANTTGTLVTDVSYDMRALNLTWKQVTASVTGSDTLHCGVTDAITGVFHGFRFNNDGSVSSMYGTNVFGSSAHADGNWYRVLGGLSGTWSYQKSTNGTVWSDVGTGGIVDGQAVQACKPYFASNHSSGTVSASIDRLNMAPGYGFSASDGTGLSDNFNTTNNAKWVYTVAAVSDGVVGADTTSPSALTSIYGWTLTDNWLLWQMTGLYLGGTYSSVLFGLTSGDVAWGFTGSSLTTIQAVVNGTATGPTRTHSDGDWYRIRHSSSGTPTLYFEYSANGETWTVLHSTTTMPSLMDFCIATFQMTPTSGIGGWNLDNVNLHPLPSTAEFIEPFNNLSQWSDQSIGTGIGQATVSGGILTLEGGTYNFDTDYVLLWGNDYYDLNGSSCAFKIMDVQDNAVGYFPLVDSAWGSFIIHDADDSIGLNYLIGGSTYGVMASNDNVLYGYDGYYDLTGWVDPFWVIVWETGGVIYCGVDIGDGTVTFAAAPAGEYSLRGPFAVSNVYGEGGDISIGYINAPLGDLTDNFNTLDAAKWYEAGDNPGAVTVTSGQLQIVTPTYAENNWLTSLDAWDIVESEMVVQVVDSGMNTTAHVTLAAVMCDYDGEGAFVFGISATPTAILGAYMYVGGVETVLQTNTYDPSYDWWRIREEEGVVYFDISTDGSTWENFAAEVTPEMPLSGMRVRLGARTDASTTSGSTTIFDNFNISTVVATGSMFFGQF